MNFRQLEAFRAVMITGSVTGAAELLHVSQPTISVVLKHAEDQIGIKLFERRGNRLHATAEAANLFSDVDGIFARMEYFREKVKAIAAGQAGMLSVAATPSLAAHYLYDIIAEFSACYPKVQILLRTSPSRYVIQDLVDHSADIGIVHGSLQGALLDSFELSSTEIVVVMPADHELAALEAIDPARLTEFMLVMNRKATPLRNVLDSYLHARGVDLHAAVEAPTLAAYDLVRRGVGVGVVDRASYDAYSGLEMRPLDPPLAAEARLLIPANRPLSVIANRFLNALKQRFCGTPIA